MLVSWFNADVDPRIELAAASRDAHLALRRVERQQSLIERLHAAGRRLTIGELARELAVSDRTIARDLERLRLSGVPVEVTPGRGGGASLRGRSGMVTIAFDVPEIAALMSSLAVLGPTVTESASSAMAKLAAAVRPADD